MSEDNGAKLQRLELYTQQLKIVALQNRIEAIKQRQQALTMEASLIPERLKAAEDEQKKMLEAYQAEYAKLKEELEVPEGHEINLETGEVVDPKQAQQQAQQ